MLATDAPNLLFVIVVPMVGLLTAFLIGFLLWKVMASILGPR